jgi:D-ribose pyranase
MKKSGILNPDLMRAIASMGHTDLLVIADSGLPIPTVVPRIDLALVAGVPSFMQTVQAVLAELQVESATVAEEMRVRSPSLYQAVRQTLGTIPLTYVSHEQFKMMLPRVRAVVRTGEQTPYANIILQSGVTF